MRIFYSLIFIFVITFAYRATAGYVIIDGKKIVVNQRGEQHYKIIPVRSMDFSIIKKVCGPWMSENGVLKYDRKRGSIVVYDYQDVIDKIRNFIADADRDVVNIRVEVEFDGVSGLDDVDWKKSPEDYDDGKIIIGGGRHNIPSGLGVEIPIHRLNLSRSNSKQFLMTTSGLPATLWVGESTVNPQWLHQLVGEKMLISKDGRVVKVSDWVDPDILFVDVGASLMIRPRYLDGGLIEVEVYPEISFKNRKGGQESIEVESVKTRLVVREGSRINIGGIINSKLSIYKNIFGKQLYRRVNGLSLLDMYLRVTVARP